MKVICVFNENGKNTKDIVEETFLLYIKREIGLKDSAIYNKADLLEVQDARYAGLQSGAVHAFIEGG